MTADKFLITAKQAYSLVRDVVVHTFCGIIMKKISALPSPFKEIFCGVMVYGVWLPVLFIPIMLLLVVKLILSLVFKIIYKDKYKLMAAEDQVHTFDNKGDIDTINFFFYVNGAVKIDELRKRIGRSLVFQDDTGARPYWKMSHVPTVKFGFKCWMEKEGDIDLKHHVRFCPGASDPKRVYSENELFQVTSEFACELWPEDKPKFEFLITPQVQVRNKVLSSILFRISHEYGDGISLMQFQRQILFDAPIPKLVFDPVNPPIPPMPFYVKCVLAFQKLIFGPTCMIKFLSFRMRNETYTTGPMKGPKYMGRTQMEIPLEMTRRIRKSLGCSTSAVFHTAFCGAIRKLAITKKLHIPKEAIGGMAQALLPYPDAHLHNYFTPIATEFTLEEDSFKRLQETNKRLKRVLQPYYVESTWWTYKALGVFPELCMQIGVGDVGCLYAMSNVPGIVGTVKFDGNPVELVFGTPPSCIGINFMIGLGCYNGKFQAGFIFNHSSLVESKQELDQFILEFERELQNFDSKAKSA